MTNEYPKVVYDPYAGKNVIDELPTQLYGKFISAAAPTVGGVLGTYVITNSTDAVYDNLRLTYLNIVSTGNAQVAIIDSSGTVDYQLIGGGGGKVTLQGDGKAPLYTLKGTVKFLYTAGAGSPTYVSFRGLRRNTGPDGVSD